MAIGPWKGDGQRSQLDKLGYKIVQTWNPYKNPQRDDNWQNLVLTDGNPRNWKMRKGKPVKVDKAKLVPYFVTDKDQELVEEHLLVGLHDTATTVADGDTQGWTNSGSNLDTEKFATYLLDVQSPLEVKGWDANPTDSFQEYWKLTRVRKDFIWNTVPFKIGSVDEDILIQKLVAVPFAQKQGGGPHKLWLMLVGYVGGGGY
jgi:hypothetical protein